MSVQGNHGSAGGGSVRTPGARISLLNTLDRPVRSRLLLSVLCFPAVKSTKTPAAGLAPACSLLVRRDGLVRVWVG